PVRKEQVMADLVAHGLFEAVRTTAVTRSERELDERLLVATRPDHAARRDAVVLGRGQALLVVTAVELQQGYAGARAEHVLATRDGDVETPLVALVRVQRRRLQALGGEERRHGRLRLRARGRSRGAGRDQLRLFFGDEARLEVRVRAEGDGRLGRVVLARGRIDRVFLDEVRVRRDGGVEVGVVRGLRHRGRVTA